MGPTTMTSREPQRAQLLTRLIAGALSATEAAELAGLSERSVWRLKRVFLERGPAGLVHGNRGRPSARRLSDEGRPRAVALARTRSAGTNDSHLAPLPAE